MRYFLRAAMAVDFRDNASRRSHQRFAFREMHVLDTIQGDE